MMTKGEQRAVRKAAAAAGQGWTVERRPDGGLEMVRHHTEAEESRHAARMERWARRYGVPLNKNPHFIINTLTLMRIAVGLQMRQPAQFLRYVDTMFHAMWVEPCNLGDAAVVGATLQKAGFDAAALAALAGDPEVKAKLIDLTDQAVKRGVFGAPTMFVGEEMFFGQDRLEFVREALA